MSLATLCLAVFLILVSISQYFLTWIQFGRTGLVITGIVGLASGVLYILEGLNVYSYKVNKP